MTVHRFAKIRHIHVSDIQTMRTQWIRFKPMPANNPRVNVAHGCIALDVVVEISKMRIRTGGT